MFENFEVDPRVEERHPEISVVDVESAWRNAFVVIERSGISLPDVVLVAVGFDTNGRVLEMVGVAEETGAIRIFHAMTPPSKKTLREAGLVGGKHGF